MNPGNHKLFKQFPIQGTASISTGEVPIPYHIYDGFGLFLGGVGDSGAVKHLLREQNVFPVTTTDGKALMGIWICNFTEASLDPHHELQFSFFVSDRAIDPVQARPFNTLVSHLTRQDIKMLCFGLWNNTANVVAYNRELLSLDALRCDSEIHQTGGKVAFVFKDTGTGKCIVSGSVGSSASFRATLSFMSQLGLRQGLQLVRQPWIGMEVINPKGVKMDRNAIARAFASSDQNAIRFFDSTDALKIEHPLYKSLNFIPHVVHYMNGYRFVYLQPEQHMTNNHPAK